MTSKLRSRRRERLHGLVRLADNTVTTINYPTNSHLPRGTHGGTTPHPAEYGEDSRALG